jgi:hypothetical protein
MGKIVFRRAHTVEMTITKLPDMSKVKWSKAQKAHRQPFKQAVAYAQAAWLNRKYAWSMKKQPQRRANAHSIWQSPITSKGTIYYQKNELAQCRSFNTLVAITPCLHIALVIRRLAQLLTNSRVE